jgi:hypothetical protein
MSMLRTVPSLAAACGLALFAAGSAFAQDAPPPPAAPSASGQHPGAGQQMAMMREHMAHRRAEHLKLLHDALSIRPDQETAWQAFTASMAPPPGAGEHKWADKGQGGQAGEPHHLTTPERLDRVAARLAERQARFQKHAEAVKAFYAALTPTQQKTFDALAALHGMHGGGHNGPMMGRGMGPNPSPAPGAPAGE